jgi:hypothetical protein
MGGYGSGNRGGRPTIEDGLVLDLNRLIRDRLFRPGTWSGSIIWSEVDSGRKVACIGYEAHMGEERGWVRLRYTKTNTWSGQKTHQDYCIDLATTPQPFGGRRWWWVCPWRDGLVAKLYKPAEGWIFASRKAHRLAYRSQRQSPHDRALSQAFKRRWRLGSREGIGDYIPKPKAMHWATFDRKMKRVQAAEAICDARLLYFVQKLARRGKR